MDTYIGCGQVVNMQKSSQIAYNFAVKHASDKTTEKLSQINCSYKDEHWLENLLFVTKLVVRHKGSLYGESSYNKLVFDFIFQKAYGYHRNDDTH